MMDDVLISNLFGHFSGDVVQATQALKESHAQRSIVLRVWARMRCPGCSTDCGSSRHKPGGAGTTDEHEKALVQLVESGLVATDMADHYGDSELVYGDFRNKLSKEVSDKVFAVTKWCVSKPIEKPVTAEFVLEQVKERCRRLGGRVELLQLHWHDFADKTYLDILLPLINIAKSHPHLVSAIGLCNFDAKHTDEACEFLKKKTGSVGVVSNQVQFSLLDSRPIKYMIPICQKHNIKLLTYGSFCGGFLSETWLTQPPPELCSSAPSTSASTPSATKRLTPSQRKYLGVIRSWGPWYDFQVLLGLLFSIAAKHGVAIHSVATRWVLQHPCVASVIIGTSLGTSSSNGSPPPGTPPRRPQRHLFASIGPPLRLLRLFASEHQAPQQPRATENLRVFGWELDEEDMRVINAAALGKDGEKTDMLLDKLGDCGDEYRNVG
ncbi:aldo keto reductase [Trichoderma cornu-damae]|uniref:Aldo keto reductase n=1 Tax=Trichoderma cornu-damae TaxID=654480 RepID=A0A9P8QIX3_9HYPO|nr:aldo keto reductase [Trichoderma cornu-damae]